MSCSLTEVPVIGRTGWERSLFSFAYPTFIPTHRQNIGDPKNTLTELENVGPNSNSPNLKWISPIKLDLYPAEGHLRNLSPFSILANCISI